MSYCNHVWVIVPDWGGNPDVPNGTFDCSYYQCTECGEERDDMPEGFEPEFNEPDYDEGDYAIDKDCDYWERNQ